MDKTARSIVRTGFLTFFIAGTSAAANAQLSIQEVKPLTHPGHGVVIADVNHDGAPDALVGTTGGVNVLLGRAEGNGGFGAATLAMIPTFSGAERIAAGDFNKDGNIDVVTNSGGAAQVMVSFGSGTGTFTGIFTGSVVYGSGDPVTDILVRDINCDGNLDIVIINTAQDRVHVLPGTTTGAFLPPVPYTTGTLSAPTAVDTSDFNLDGRLDIVASGSVGVTLLFGTGGGALGSPLSFGGSLNNSDIGVGDFNNNGLPDVFCSSTTSGSGAVYSGNGFGLAFSTFVNLSAISTSCLVADMNDDGNADVAAVVQPTNNLAWALGDGNNTFGGVQLLASGNAGPSRIAAADLNHDGHTDLLVSYTAGPALVTFLGSVQRRGFLQLSPVTNMNMGIFTTSCGTLADFNHDGHVDLMMGSVTGNPFYLANNGAGIFSYVWSLASSFGNFRQMLHGDFNCDGNTDFASAHIGGAGSLACSLVAANGFVTGTAFTSVGGGACNSLAMADINFDGKLDIAINDSASQKTYICLGNGLGGFTVANNLTPGGAPTRLKIADFNNDGKQDIVEVCSIINQVVVFPGLASPNFGSAQYYASAGTPTDVDVADFDQNGSADIVITNGGLSATVQLFLNAGTGFFAPALATTTPGNGLARIAAADFNQDGRVDIAVGASCNTSSILLGSGNGKFLPGANIATSCNITDVLVDDLNHDGRPDTVFITENAAGPAIVAITATPASGNDYYTEPNNLNSGGNLMFVATGDTRHNGSPDLLAADYTNSRVNVRLNAGGNFSADTPVPMGALPRPFALADINIDGNLDLVVPSQATNSVGVRLGSGIGSYGPVNSYVAGANPLWAAAGDITNDGLPDVVTANFSGNNISLLFNIGAGTFGAPTNIGVSALPIVVALTDFTVDGITDIAVGSYAGPNADVLLGLGGGTFAAPITLGLPAGSLCTGIETCDLNLDGGMDMITSNFSSDTVTTFFGSGTGVFVGFNYSAGTGPIYTACSDYNFDGVLDLAVANNTSNDISLLFGLSGFGFAPQVRRPAGQSQRNIAVSDHNLDGRPDFAIASFGGSELSLLRNTYGSPLFTSRFGAGTPGCFGTLVLNVNKIPQVNTPDFAFHCTGFPANTLGLGLVTDVADFPGSNSLNLGALIHVDLVNMTEFYWFNIYGDRDNLGNGPIAIPNDNSLIGKTYYAQAIAFESSATAYGCSTSSLKCVSSQGVQIVIQP